MAISVDISESYADLLDPGDRVFDAMGNRVSHLPDARYERVVVHGRKDAADAVDAVQYPGAVFAEFARVLAPGGVLVVSFTNRMFPTRAVRAWRSADMAGRVDLVRSYVEA